jgi:S-DNA-T family DNA segregation ATPase FtsK/SpoIIIE
MDVALRTPHGAADVAVRVNGDDTTLADLIVAVTGQAAPRVVDVDGRAVPTTTRLRDARVLCGSTISSIDADEPPRGVVALTQVAGHGAGRSVELTPARYRVGPGRRSSADELTPSPVENAVFDVDVLEGGRGRRVEVIASSNEPLTVDGRRVEDRSTVTTELVATTNRAFVLEEPPEPPAEPDLTPDRGTLPFNRPPRHDRTDTDRPVVDALRRAEQRATSIWRVRPDDPDAFVVPVGVSTDPADAAHPTVTVDLGRGGLAVVGSDQFRSGLVRTVLVEAATRHSPTDLDVVVATSRPADWEWAKWLPHLRDGDPHRPAHIHAPDAVGPALGEQWAGRRLVVVDDPTTWLRLDAPLRSLVNEPPEGLVVVAMCSAHSEIPAGCASTVEATRSGRVTVTGRGRHTVEQVIASQLEEPLAERAARRLAPLVDTQTAQRRAQPSTPPTWSELLELPDGAGVTDVRHRWSTTNELRWRRAVVVGDDETGVTAAACALVTEAALTTPPDQLRIVPVTNAGSAIAELVRRLPHADRRIGPEGDDPPGLDVVEPARLLRRIRAWVSGGGRRVLLAVDVDEDGAAVDELARLASGVPGVHTIRVAHAGTVDAAPETTASVTVRHRGDQRWMAMRFDDGDEDVRVLPEPTRERLDVRPAVVGRSLTPLERRLHNRHRGVLEPDLARIARLLLDASGPVEAVSLVPDPFPDRVELDGFLARHPGDGVPLARIDRPEADEPSAWWWRPGAGSVIATGGPDAALDVLVDDVLVAIAERISPDELAVVAVVGETRLAAARMLPHTTAAAAPDSVEAVDLVVAAARDAGPRPALVLVDDLDVLMQTAGGHQRADELRAALVDLATGAPAPELIAVTVDPADAEPLLRVAAHRLVGWFDDAVTAAGLGLDDAAEVATPHRAVVLPDDVRVQLAEPTGDLETALGRRLEADHGVGGPDGD